MADGLQALLRRGFDALNRGDPQAAAAVCRESLDAAPDSPQAHFLVGLVAMETDDRPNAHRAFRTVVKLDPDNAAAWAQLARLNASEGRVVQAEKALLETRRLKPSDPAVLDTIGTVLTQMGEYDAAKAFFARANTSGPRTPQYMMNLANNLVFLGEIGTAKSIFDDVIRTHPNSPQAHWGLANAAKATDDRHIQQMQQLLGRNAGNLRGQGFLNYAMGKEFEDLGVWPDAFAAFAAGAAARRQTVEYDEAGEEALFGVIENLFTAKWLRKASMGSPDSSPIFVLGQPRTGTTLIERIITSHSMVHSAGELQQFGLSIRRLAQIPNPRRFSPELFQAAAALEPKRLGTAYLQSTQRMRGKTPRFVDKLPVNYMNIGLILAALPNARIVHLVRGAMDACFASFKQLFADAYLHSYDQEEMARHHVRYRRLMAHWRREFPGRIINVSYEDTARDVEPHARSLIEALGLDWEDACLDFHTSSQGVATASAVQVREPAHTRSIGRWHRYETALQPMVQILEDAGIPLE